MPDVDFMVICDHVRMDGGVLHILAAGIDRIHAPSVPTQAAIGIALRLSLTRAECGRSHRIELIFQSEDGDQLLQFSAAFSSDYPEDVPAGWPANAGVPLNIAIPIPAYGRYSFELLINDESKKSIPLMVAPPQSIQAVGQ